MVTQWSYFEEASALPFNDDMHHTRVLRTGSSARGKPVGSIPIGSPWATITSKEDAMKLTNPIKGDKVSELNGERLFAVNCSPCHGTYTPQGRVMTPIVGMQFAPDISSEAYRIRSDGDMFGVIHFGGMAIMPAYGFKFSVTEHWDIVNYLRKVQNFNK